jgi:CPA2 family monovalent cation:H+ antiporter-2
MGRAGVDAGLLPAALWQTLLGASVATMVATPALLAVAPVVAAWGRGGGRRAAGPAARDIPPLSGHVIVLGFGVGGRLVARAIRDLGAPYVILELNAATVRQARADGEQILYGDASSPENLHAAGIESAIAVVSLLSDPDATQRMVKAVRAISPAVPIVVRARYRLEAERLQALGATVAVAEELEASLEVAAQLLSRLHVPGNTIEALLDLFRHESVSVRPARAPRAMLRFLPEPLQEMPVSSHRVDAGQWAIGRTVAELNLRAQAGTSILAVQRRDRYLTTLSPDEAIESGDVLYLTGDDRDVILARRRLEKGE